MSNPVPFDGFKLLITDMQNYSKGDDIRLVDDHGLVVTVVLDSISDKVTGILVGNIDEMYDVRQIQTSVKRQMGEPSMGYEVIRNYDGDNNSVWTDYSTFEFVYRYNIGYTTYDFHLSQVGAAMKNNHVVHPYNFSAIVTRRVDKQLSVNQQQAIQQSLGDGNTVVDGSLKTGEGFYPKEGTARYDDCSIETKVLTKW